VQVFKTTPQACNFHLQKQVIHHLGTIHAKSRFNNDHNFEIAVRCLTSLSFVPPKHVARVFKEISWPTDRPFAKLKRYFEV
jgi:hypothetical protein